MQNTVPDLHKTVKASKTQGSQSLTSLDCAPLRKVRSDRAINYGKRKISEASRQLARNISEALEQLSLSSVDSCADCEQLMYELTEKLNISDRRQIY